MNIGIPSVAMPSFEFLNQKGRLAAIAIYAKVANQMDLYNQAKKAHDDMVRQYNNAIRPQNPSKKRRWSPFSVEEYTLSAPLEYFDDDSIFQLLYEDAKKLSQYELNKRLREAVSSFHGF